LLKGTREPALDGVTGQIRLDHDQEFVRELTPAQFNGGKIVVQGPRR